MEGDPALIVRLVDAGSMLHQESHHVNIVIYARLREEREQMGKATERSKGHQLPCVSMCFSVCILCQWDSLCYSYKQPG